MPAEFFFDIEQGTESWRKARSGIITASRFKDVSYNKGESVGRSKYMRQLAGEVITGQPTETYTNAHMDRGKIGEARIRNLFAFESGLDLTQVGFIRNGDIGASPDAVYGWDGERVSGGVEIKSMLADLLIEVFERKAGDEPPQFRHQIQGSMMVCEVDEWHLVIGAESDRLPPFTKRIKRDTSYCMTMRSELRRFSDELAAMVERMKARGARLPS